MMPKFDVHRPKTKNNAEIRPELTLIGHKSTPKTQNRTPTAKT